MSATTTNRNDAPKPYMNPYLAGVLLGLVLLTSFLVLGAGLGASAGIARVGAFCQAALLPETTRASEYFGAWGEAPLRYYLVFMLVGVLVGGFFSAYQARRIEVKVERGARSPRSLRLYLALGGGILVGFASRLAGGCTSGQALTGGAMLLSGSLVFMGCIFIGGYAAARFVRRQWDD